MTGISEAAIGSPGLEPADGPGCEGDEDGRSERAERWALGSVVAAIGIAALVVWREAETEPYHIDELRQVRPYAWGLDALLDGSYSQEQPPLDVLVGAAFQRVLGVGDVLQRGHSMLAGVIALSCLAVLLWRYRVRIGIPISILVLAFSPFFISYTAYARPYALPLALMVGFLLMVDVWLDRGTWWSGAAVVVLAALLPASRVFEPPAFLVLVSVTLLIARRGHGEWGRRVWLPVASAAAALVLVEIPMYLQLRSRLNRYQGEDSATLGEQLRRVIDDSLPGLANVFVNGTTALVLVAAAVAMPSVRRWLAACWWFWPMLLTPIAFFVAFHLRTQPGQPFYSRYGYFWLPPFAILVGLLAEHLVQYFRSAPVRQPTRIVAGVLVVLLAAYGVQLGVATADDLRTTKQGDYRSLGLEIESRLPVTTAVVFDSTGISLGSYRPGYAGYGRYTSPERSVFKAESLIGAPERAGGVEEFVIATNGPVLDVDGWTAVPTSPTMTLYLPDTPRSGIAELAAELVRFGEVHDAARGATLRLAGAMILIDIGEADEGCAVIERLVAEDPTITSRVTSALDVFGASDRARQCLRG